MPVWEPTPDSGPSYPGGPSWHEKYQPGEGYRTPIGPEPYEHWHHTWHLWPGNQNQGQFRTTAPVVESALLARPWEIPELRYISEQNPDGWRSTMEGAPATSQQTHRVSELTDEPWKFEVDPAGRLKCLCCCASATGSCGRPGHDRPGLLARARAEVANRPPPPEWKPAGPQVADGYGRLAGPREWGGGAASASQQQQQQQQYTASVSPPRNGNGGRGGGGGQIRAGPQQTLDYTR